MPSGRPGTQPGQWAATAGRPAAGRSARHVGHYRSPPPAPAPSAAATGAAPAGSAPCCVRRPRSNARAAAGQLRHPDRPRPSRTAFAIGDDPGPSQRPSPKARASGRFRGPSHWVITLTLRRHRSARISPPRPRHPPHPRQGIPAAPRSSSAGPGHRLRSWAAPSFHAPPRPAATLRRAPRPGNTAAEKEWLTEN